MDSMVLTTTLSLLTESMRKGQQVIVFGQFQIHPQGKEKVFVCEQVLESVESNVSQLTAKQLVSSISDTLSKLTDNFNNFSKELENKATNSIKEQNDNLYKNSINFGKETSDFSKSNISINAGNLIASQANIIQEQSVRLLS